MTPEERVAKIESMGPWEGPLTVQVGRYHLVREIELAEREAREEEAGEIARLVECVPVAGFGLADKIRQRHAKPEKCLQDEPTWFTMPLPQQDALDARIRKIVHEELSHLTNASPSYSWVQSFVREEIDRDRA